MNKTGIQVSKKIYSALLTLYPKEYMSEFGEEMKYVFSEQLKESYNDNGEYGILKLWSQTIVDTGKSLVTQHIEDTKGGIFMKSKNITRIALITAIILSIPLVAMQFTSEMNWSLSDFLIIGCLVFGTGLLFEFFSSKVKKKAHKVMIGLGLLTLMLWIWVELAVGLFTNWGS